VRPATTPSRPMHRAPRHDDRGRKRATPSRPRAAPTVPPRPGRPPVGHRQPHGLDNQRGVARPWDRRRGPCPPGGHRHAPFGPRPGLRTAPAPSRPLTDLTRRPPVGLADLGPRAIPARLPEDRPQAPWRRPGGRAGLAPREDLVALRRALPQPLHRALGDLWPQARAPALRLVRPVITAQHAAQAQSNDQQPPWAGRP
jgi:hypothetical protein